MRWRILHATGCHGTVTTTPTVTASVASTTRATATTPGSTAKSDVVGRKFDLGTIVRVQNDGGVPVIILDRWTAYGVTDSTLAANLPDAKTIAKIAFPTQKQMDAAKATLAAQWGPMVADK